MPKQNKTFYIKLLEIIAKKAENSDLFLSRFKSEFYKIHIKFSFEFSKEIKKFKHNLAKIAEFFQKG